jgi:hypothetical protein
MNIYVCNLEETKLRFISVQFAVNNLCICQCTLESFLSILFSVWKEKIVTSTMGIVYE